VFYDDPDGNAFEVPERVQGKAGDEVPDTPLQLRSGLVEDRIVDGDVALLSTLAGVSPGVLWLRRCVVSRNWWLNLP
jgi:hypothetical protein